MASEYTNIENDILEFLYAADLSGAEIQVLIFLIRNSKSFHRSTAKAGYNYIVNGTGLSKSTVKRILKKYMDLGWITEEYSPNGISERIVKLEWSCLTPEGVHVRPHRGFKRGHPRVVMDGHQETKEEIKNKKIKNKKRTSSSLPTKKMNDTSVEECREWMDKLTPEQWEMWKRDELV